MGIAIFHCRSFTVVLRKHRRRHMPFDGALSEVEPVKAAVRKWREMGRLICDNPTLFDNSDFAYEHKGETYVCALGAVGNELGESYYKNLRGSAALFTRKLMLAHDMLFQARKDGVPNVEEWETAFEKLLA
jgi:hypothetical protein